MADIRLSCPHCQQIITCDEAWCGHELQCPTCQGGFLVPAVQATAAHPPTAPKVPKNTNPRLSLGGHSQQPAQQGRAIPIRNLAGPAPKRSNPIVKIAGGAVTVIALGVGGYFGYQYYVERQESANAQPAAPERRASRRPPGPSADTAKAPETPSAPSGESSPDGTSPGRNRAAAAAPEAQVTSDAAAPAAPSTTNQPAPVIPAAYTLDVARAKIPECRVNGTISGTNFLAETVRIDQAGAAQVLRLVQGPITSPNYGVLVYLKLKPGEKIGGQKLTVTEEMKTGVPSVTKLWRPDPKFAARKQSYFSGYALKLELGQPTNDVVPGKIFLALPDKEQSVVAGAFEASTAVVEVSGQPATPQATPMAPGPTMPDRAAYERRYGLRPRN